jgi:hypothetical protein
MPYYSTRNLIYEVLVNETRDKYLYNSHRSFKFKDNKFYSYNTLIAEFIDESNYLHIHKKTAKLGEFISMTTSKQVNYIITSCQENNIPHNFDNDYKHTLEEIYIEEDDYECPISYENIKKGLKTKCGHIFEKKCIEKWLKQSNKCPLCRTQIL